MVSALETRTFMSFHSVLRYYDVHLWLHTDLKRCDALCPSALIQWNRLIMSQLYLPFPQTLAVLLMFLDSFGVGRIAIQIFSWLLLNRNSTIRVQEDFQNIQYLSFSYSRLFVVNANVEHMIAHVYLMFGQSLDPVCNMSCSKPE